MNAAMAAASQVQGSTTTHVATHISAHVSNVARARNVRPGADYAAVSGNYPPQYYASLNYTFSQIGQFMQSVTSGVPMPEAELQLARNVARWRAAHHIGGTYYFSYDN